jgi:hypothetical protein
MIRLDRACQVGGRVDIGIGAGSRHLPGRARGEPSAAGRTAIASASRQPNAARRATGCAGVIGVTGTDRPVAQPGRQRDLSADRWLVAEEDQDRLRVRIDNRHAHLGELGPRSGGVADLARHARRCRLGRIGVGAF